MKSKNYYKKKINRMNSKENIMDITRTSAIFFLVLILTISFSNNTILAKQGKLLFSKKLFF